MSKPGTKLGTASLVLGLRAAFVWTDEAFWIPENRTLLAAPQA